MARLPDRFDLAVRKARESRDLERQADYVLGALAGVSEWHFFNVGTKEAPQPAEGEIEKGRYLLVFSSRERIEEMLGDAVKGQPLPVITISTEQAMSWCMELKAMGCAGLLVNPAEDGFMVPMDRLEAFHAEWKKRGGKQASGFWIPNMTTEEEDFWQEHGL